MITKYKLVVCALTLLIKSILSQINTIEYYNNISGNQVYLWRDDPFAFISIDTTSKLLFKAEFHIYFTIPYDTIVQQSFWIAIGIGQMQMSQSDIILCAIMSDDTQSCTDYDAKGWSLVIKTTQKVKLIKFTKENLDSKWSPYKTHVSFAFERDIDPERIDGIMNLDKILSGDESIVSAYGKMTKNIPNKHNNQMIGFKTKDGSTVNNELIKTSSQIELEAVTISATHSLIPITNKKSFLNSSFHKVSNALIIILMMCLIV